MAKKETTETLNYAVGLLNCMTLLIFSLPMIAAGIWMSFSFTSDCDSLGNFLPLAGGALLFIVTLVGVIGVWGRVNWILLLHLVMLSILILCFVGFSAFGYAVTDKDAGMGKIRRIAGHDYGDNYSKWIWNRVSNAKNWNRTKKCLVDGRACKILAEFNQTYPKKFSTHIELVRLQSGCCNPPESCRFVNSSSSPATALRRENSTINHQSLSDQDDCSEYWSDESKSFCLNCESCKVSVLENLKDNWRSVANYYIFISSLLMVIFCLGCYTFHKNWQVNLQVCPMASN